MKGSGVPLVTPFEKNGDINENLLKETVEMVISGGVDFIVPCGSNSEAELMTVEERATATRIVNEAASVPVVAGVGHPGFRETSKQLQMAVDAGVDAALVVTPFYFDHDQQAVRQYYTDLANESEIPIYLYSVPAFTNKALSPQTVGKLAEHENIHGIKDSSGDIQNLQRLINHTGPEFHVLVGSGGVYAQALGVGASGGVMALANVVPEQVSEIYDLIHHNDHESAQTINKNLVELNHAVTSEYGVPGLKSAMRLRGMPAGHVRRPFNRVSESVSETIKTLLEECT